MVRRIHCMGQLYRVIWYVKRTRFPPSPRPTLAQTPHLLPKRPSSPINPHPKPEDPSPYKDMVRPAERRTQLYLRDCLHTAKGAEVQGCPLVLNGGRTRTWQGSRVLQACKSYQGCPLMPNRGNEGGTAGVLASCGHVKVPRGWRRVLNGAKRACIHNPAVSVSPEQGGIK